MTGNVTMKTVTDRLPAKPSPNAFRILTGDSPPIRPATIPAAVTTSIELIRSGEPDDHDRDSEQNPHGSSRRDRAIPLTIGDC